MRQAITRLLPLAIVVALFLAVMPARADTMYEFVTSNTPFGIITATLPATPIPTSFTATSFDYDVTAVVDGDQVTVPVTFFTDSAGGGAEGQGTRINGPVLFTGTTSSPMFLTGTFAFDDFTLTVSEASPIPEPSSLLLLGSGSLTGAYAIIRRRRRTVAGV